jgi:hypothetical protein
MQVLPDALGSVLIEAVGEIPAARWALAECSWIRIPSPGGF